MIHTQRHGILKIIVLSILIFFLKKGNIIYSQTLTIEKIAKKLDTIGENDQIDRFKIDSIEKNWSEDSKYLSDSLWLHINKIDSLNTIELDKFRTQYGWNNLMKLNDSRKYIIFLIIQHSDSISQEKYLPYVYTSVKKKQLPADYFVLIKDRIELRKNGTQYYGSQYYWDDIKKKNVLFPLNTDITEVERRRKALGLNSLKSYIKYINE